MKKYFYLALLITIPLQGITGDINPREIKYLGEVKRISKPGSHRDYRHYCHMNTVYLSGSEIKMDSMALVWNHDTGQPLKCSEYNTYTGINPTKR